MLLTTNLQIFCKMIFFSNSIFIIKSVIDPEELLSSNGPGAGQLVFTIVKFQQLNVFLIGKQRDKLMCLVIFDVVHGCLYNQALADVRSTGKGIKYLYCT